MEKKKEYYRTQIININNILKHIDEYNLTLSEQVKLCKMVDYFVNALAELELEIE